MAEKLLGTFVLKIELGNDAMSGPDDIVRALAEVTEAIINREQYPQVIKDVNGNTCGEWTVVPYYDS